MSSSSSILGEDTPLDANATRLGRLLDRRIETRFNVPSLESTLEPPSFADDFQDFSVPRRAPTKQPEVWLSPSFQKTRPSVPWWAWLCLGLIALGLVFLLLAALGGFQWTAHSACYEDEAADVEEG